MVEWTSAEIAQASKALGLSPAKVRQMAEADVLDKEKALNGFAMPEGGIRFSDACEKYHLGKGTLASWVQRGHVRELSRPSWKYSILAEQDIMERVQRMHPA